MPIFATGDLDGIPGAALSCLWTSLPRCSPYRVCIYLVPFPGVHASARAKFGIVASLLAQSPCCPSLEGTSTDPTVHLLFLLWVCTGHGSVPHALPYFLGRLDAVVDRVCAACTSRVDRGITSERWKRKGRTFIRGTSSESHLPFFCDTPTVRSPVGNVRSTTTVACTWVRNEVHWSGHGRICFDHWHLVCLLRHVRSLAFDSCVRRPSCPRCTAWLCPCAVAHLFHTQHHGSQRFSTVYNGLQQRHNPSQPVPGRPLHNASQRICPPRPSIPWVGLPILLASSRSILVVPAGFSWSFPAPVPCSSTNSTVLGTCSWRSGPPTNAEGIRPSAVASC